MEKVLEKISDGLLDFSGKLLASLLIIVIGFKIVNIISKRINKGRVFNKL